MKTVVNSEQVAVFLQGTNMTDNLNCPVDVHLYDIRGLRDEEKIICHTMHAHNYLVPVLVCTGKPLNKTRAIVLVIHVPSVLIAMDYSCMLCKALGFIVVVIASIPCPIIIIRQSSVQLGSHNLCSLCGLSNMWHLHQVGGTRDNITYMHAGREP